MKNVKFAARSGLFVLLPYAKLEWRQESKELNSAAQEFWHNIIATAWFSNRTPCPFAFLNDQLQSSTTMSLSPYPCVKVERRQSSRERARRSWAWLRFCSIPCLAEFFPAGSLPESAAFITKAGSIFWWTKRGPKLHGILSLAKSFLPVSGESATNWPQGCSNSLEIMSRSLSSVRVSVKNVLSLLPKLSFNNIYIYTHSCHASWKKGKGWLPYDYMKLLLLPWIRQSNLTQIHNLPVMKAANHGKAALCTRHVVILTSKQRNTKPNVG